MTTTVRTIFSINATDRSHDFLVIRRGPAGISIEAQSREDEWESATAGPFTPEQLRAALDEVAPAGSYTRTDEGWQARAEKAERRACPDLDAHWRLDQAIDRAEKAKQERAQHSPITADDITDEARGRAYRAVAALSVSDWDDISGVAKGRAMALVEAVITEITRPEPPARPEGAEELARLIATADVGEWDCGDLADALLTTGRVRVVSEDGAA